MNCLEFRRRTLIDPNDPHPARLAHKETCERCARFSEQMLYQDELIREAADINAPEGFAARILLNQSLQSQSRRPTRWYWLSLAASFLLAVVLIPPLLQQEPAFEERLAVHMEHHNVLESEHDVFAASPEGIAEVLAGADTALPPEIGNIRYAATCIVDGETMAHLMVEHDDGDYVVFLVPERQLPSYAFETDDWTGEVTPILARSMVVMGMARQTDPTRVRSLTEHLSHQFQQRLSPSGTI